MNTVRFLVENNFPTLGIEEKCKIKPLGRPLPSLNIIQKQTSRDAARVLSTADSEAQSLDNGGDEAAISDIQGAARVLSTADSEARSLDAARVLFTADSEARSLGRHWKDTANPNMGRGGMHCSPGMPQNEMPGNGSNNMKPDGRPLLGNPGSGAGGVNSWNEPPLTPTSWGGVKPKTPPKQGQKTLKKDSVSASKQFRIIADKDYKGPGGVSNAPSLLNNLNNANPSLASINSISPALFQKILTQQPPPQQPPPQQPASFNQAPRTQNQPSATQLRMLVQQIQMAVQAGYLDPQILNQPLAPQTLLLLNQLLQQNKVLQQLKEQQDIIKYKLKRTEKQIIILGQAISVKQQEQQQQQQHHMTHQGDFVQPNMHDPLSALQSNFGNLTINKELQVASVKQQKQLGLNQYKLPSMNKDGDATNNEFSHTPGTTTEPSVAQSLSSPNINPLLGQGDGTWSTASRSSTNTGCSETGNDVTRRPEKRDPWHVTSQSGASNFIDLVPEFEPGKPWKGTQMKSIEGDPSITPGSVMRSLLSLATIKDSASPTVSSAVDTPLTVLSSCIWSFNPPPLTSLRSTQAPS